MQIDGTYVLFYEFVPFLVNLMNNCEWAIMKVLYTETYEQTNKMIRDVVDLTQGDCLDKAYFVLMGR